MGFAVDLFLALNDAGMVIFPAFLFTFVTVKIFYIKNLRTVIIVFGVFWLYFFLISMLRAQIRFVSHNSEIGIFRFFIDERTDFYTFDPNVDQQPSIFWSLTVPVIESLRSAGMILSFILACSGLYRFLKLLITKNKIDFCLKKSIMVVCVVAIFVAAVTTAILPTFFVQPRYALGGITHSLTVEGMHITSAQEEPISDDVHETMLEKVSLNDLSGIAELIFKHDLIVSNRTYTDTTEGVILEFVSIAPILLYNEQVGFGGLQLLVSMAGEVLIAPEGRVYPEAAPWISVQIVNAPHIFSVQGAVGSSFQLRDASTSLYVTGRVDMRTIEIRGSWRMFENEFRNIIFRGKII